MSNTEQKIKIQLERMDQKKQTLMHIIHSLPTENYLRNPQPNSWSVGQIANHLYLSERLSLAYLKKKLSYPDTIPPFSIKSWWSLYAVNFILWSPFKVKAPPAINMWKDIEILSPDDLDTKWNQIRKDLAALIAEHRPSFHHHLVFNHPLSGRMTMTQMLIFFNHHIAHHIRQIRRVIRKIS
ncbi:MAG: DinB family protein [Saprospiraceae bacterium]